jgi:hypothetical protein
MDAPYRRQASLYLWQYDNYWLFDYSEDRPYGRLGELWDLQSSHFCSFFC